MGYKTESNKQAGRTKTHRPKYLILEKQLSNDIR